MSNKEDDRVRSGEAVDSRARRSGGVSGHAIYRMVRRALSERAVTGALVVDVGCGTGLLRAEVTSHFERYIGVDAVRYNDLPSDVEFVQVDLDSGSAPLPNAIADLVVAVETIEHVENPRAFVRELVRLAKPDGWIVVTTPNQLSLLSLLNLCIRKRFVAFKEENYPAHLTALLPIDLLRISGECGLHDCAILYSGEGRIPLISKTYPRALSRLFPSALSDNTMLIGRKSARGFQSADHSLEGDCRSPSRTPTLE